jgi:ubiquinone/menaquinone biosynthesis C-methylase UbiE
MKRNEKNESREERLLSLLKHSLPGKIIEFGCGGGDILQILSKNFPESLIVGIDINREKINKVNKRNLKNVIVFQSDVGSDIFPKNSFNTSILIGVLHEIYSYQGREQITNAIKNAYNVLKKNGRLLIGDFLKPKSKQVDLIFKNDKACNKFSRFANEYEVRKINYKKMGNKIILDIVDAVEFLSKYFSPTEEDWKEEMKEAHFSLTMDDFRNKLEKAGFELIWIKELPWHEWKLKEFRKDLTFHNESELRSILIVAEKI